MDLTSNKAIIVAAGIGGAYPVGIDRLERSLQFHGWCGHTKFWRDYPYGCPPHDLEGQYNFKIYAIQWAIDNGYTHILWCDASIYAVKNPMPIFDWINDNGVFAFRTGYPLSATTTDALLQYTHTEREALILVPEQASGVVGLNINNPVGRKTFELWKEYMQAGLFAGSRTKSPRDSTHPLFKHARQDQAAFAMALYQQEITETGHDKEWVSYYGGGYNEERLIFFVQGL